MLCWQVHRSDGPVFLLIMQGNWINSLIPLTFAKSVLYDLQVFVEACVIVWSQSGVWLFCDPMDCSAPGWPVHGILQARILDWVAIPSPGDLPDPGTDPGSPAWACRSFTFEPPVKPLVKTHSNLNNTSRGNISPCELSTFLVIKSYFTVLKKPVLLDCIIFSFFVF